MKKTIFAVLAVLSELGRAGMAMAAANPFVDVPARHWAYDAVGKLTEKGVVEGYRGGNYFGTRLATRYEMAQIVACAMARADSSSVEMKATVDKLALEFAKELRQLGVRVEQLEKDTSSIKFSGDMRLRRQSNPDLDTLYNGGGNVPSVWDNRIRINATADIADNLTFISRMFALLPSSPTATTDTTIHPTWEIAMAEYSFSPEEKLAIGRLPVFLGQGLIADADTGGGLDGVGFSFGKSWKVSYSYGDISSAGQVTDRPATWVSLLNISYPTSKYVTLTGAALYSHTNGTASIADGSYSSGYPFQIYGVGFNGKPGPNFTWIGEYAWNVSQVARTAYTDDARTAWYTRVWYKGAEAETKGTWGLYVDYRDVKPYSIDPVLTTLNCGNVADGFKGFGLGFNWTVAKNMVLTGAAEFLSQNRATSPAANTQYSPYFSLDVTYTF